MTWALIALGAAVGVLSLEVLLGWLRCCGVAFFDREVVVGAALGATEVLLAWWTRSATVDPAEKAALRVLRMLGAQCAGVASYLVLATAAYFGSFWLLPVPSDFTPLVIARGLPHLVGAVMVVMISDLAATALGRGGGRIALGQGVRVALVLALNASSVVLVDAAIRHQPMESRTHCNMSRLLPADPACPHQPLPPGNRSDDAATLVR